MEQKDLKKRMDAMILSLNDERLRWLIGRGKTLVDQGKITLEEYEETMIDILQTEMERKMVINALKSGPLTVSEISSLVKLPPKTVLKHLIALRRDSAVGIGERHDELEFQRFETPLDDVNILSLPDQLRKTASVILKLSRATAASVANENGRETAIESRYLEQLVEMGYLRIEEHGNDVYFHV